MSRPPLRDADEVSLFVSHAPWLARYFRRKTRDPEEASDLVQETFVRLLGSASATNLVNPAAFLQRIARNLLVDRARRNASRPKLVAAEFGLEASVEPDQTSRLEQEELAQAYRRAVDRLPPRTREVFLLHRIEGLTYAQIAGRLRISVRTVEWHIAEAILRIRRGIDAQ